MHGTVVMMSSALYQVYIVMVVGWFWEDAIGLFGEVSWKKKKKAIKCLGQYPTCMCYQKSNKTMLVMKG